MASIDKKTITTVIRVKRKRKEDPINTLVIASDAKKKKVSNELGTETVNLFTLAGTIESKESTKDIIDKFRQGNINLKNSSPEKNKKQRRQKEKDKQKAARFTVISNKRELSNLPEDVQLVDAIADDDDDDLEQDGDGDVLLCNSVKMIREKLHIDDKKKIESDEFVYDLYFAPNNLILNAESEILKLEEYFDEVYFVDDEADEEEGLYDDEDDENAEDNWRNDYPDEDSSDPEKDGDSNKNSDDDDDDNDYYDNDRYRKGEGRLAFDPYARDNGEEFFNTLSDSEEGDN